MTPEFEKLKSNHELVNEEDADSAAFFTKSGEKGQTKKSQKSLLPQNRDENLTACIPRLFRYYFHRS